MAIIAAPSRLLPGTTAQNAHFLAQRAEGRIQEIALCFFETEASLAYTADDLPETLAELPFSWHMHLPVDLPWHTGAGASANCALRLLRKAQALKPRMAVLHAPALPARKGLLAAFADIWYTRCSTPLLLENIEDCDLLDLTRIIVDAEFGVCLDLGHMLAYGQEDVVNVPELVSRVRLAHWSAPGGADRHLPLTRLTPEEKASLKAVAAKLPDTAAHLLEIFDWNGVEESLALLPDLIPSRPADKTGQEAPHAPTAKTPC
jgi:sugar phosphate isomerase/epimerase